MTAQIFSYLRLKQWRYRRHLPVLLFSLFFISITACEAPISGMSVSNVSAVWDKDNALLKVSGEVASGEDYVEIHDANSGKLLGAAVVQTDGTWSATSSSAACSVHIGTSAANETFPVENAPIDCSSNTDLARAAVIDVPIDVKVAPNPQLNNSVPNAIILSPPSDITINVGQSVNFAGVATGLSIVPPVNYYWSFGGAAPNTTVQNPGLIQFNIPGTYVIQLTATDNLGIPDPTPATRTIVVTGNGNTPVANTPVPVINSPVAIGGSVSVNVGDSLFFSGSASDGTGASNFFYEWTFSGAAPNQFIATPGSVTFNNAGIYVVSLFATNALGTRSAIPATVTVNVGVGNGGGSSVNQAPDGNIVSPNTDVTINVGDTLNFRARGDDPDNNQPLNFSWNFNGVAPDIFMSPSRSAGNITFNNPGLYVITMTVRDALGLADPTPAVRRVTVLSPGSGGGNGPLTGQIISPPFDVTIAPGQSVFFSGQVAANLPGPFMYFWTFDGVAPNSTAQTPGDITFPVPGIYDVQLTVADISGNVIGTPTIRTITVSTNAGNGGGGTGAQLGVQIVSPIDNAMVQVGQPMLLQGNVSNVTGLVDVDFRWRIKDSNTNNDVFSSSSLSPGTFTFTQAGTYRVRFRVSGTDPVSGNRVTESSSSTVIVSDTGLANTDLIAQPAQDMIVNVGQNLIFIAAPINGINLTYRWSFDGLAPDSFEINPPPVLFTQAGTFRVRLRVRGQTTTGAPLDMSDTRTITVNNFVPSPAPSPFPPPPTPTQPPVSGAATPDGIIDQPVTNITVRVGTAVTFSGRGFDPLGLGQLQFIWSFGGAVPNILSPFPGQVTFNRVGNYVVSLLVVNAIGQVDPTPDTVVVTVTP